MTLTERGSAWGLRLLTRLARWRIAGPFAERLVYRLSKTGFRTVGAAGRTFVAAQKLVRPARQKPVAAADRFDLTPTDEQRMLREAVEGFARERVRSAASDADAACAPPADLLAQSSELGLATLGVPEELGGPVGERSAVTSTLLCEALAHGDMGLAVACLAPGAIGTALGLWGDADQQARYLPAFAGDDVPAAALAVLEPRALFDPFALQTRARRVDGGYRVSGVKALVPRAAKAELFLVAAELDSEPALFIVESGTSGVFTEPEPAMGLRAAATGRLILEDVASAGVLQADYAECVRRARLAWCALAVGAAQAVLDHVIPYVNERVAFGEPVSHRQGVAFAVADIGVELEGMRLLTYRAAARADRGEDFARDVALARRLCAAKGMAIGSDGVQLLGGHGYVKDHPVERWYRDLRAVGLMEGTILV